MPATFVMSLHFYEIIYFFANLRWFEINFELNGKDVSLESISLNFGTETFLANIQQC